MRKAIIFLAGIIALYLISSLALHLVYGPSFPFLSGEDCWMPDGQSGWRAHGHPSAPPPFEPSVNVPLLLTYLPIFLPGALLILFTLTPLRKMIETVPPATSEERPGPESDRPPSAT
jgi:hypothetical protein